MRKQDVFCALYSIHGMHVLFHLVASESSLRKAFAAYGGEPLTEYESLYGFCASDGTPNARKIYLCCQNLTVGAISHEVLHAVLQLYEEKRHAIYFPGDKRGRMQETLCYMVGEFTDAIWKDVQPYLKGEER